jgi:hypothetical protein
MQEQRVHFGSRLKEQREARQLSLGDVARMTKIPERSLERLEHGRFEELPAEVFVRGFVRSYARVVGLDPEDMARRYGEVVTGKPGEAAPAPVASVITDEQPGPRRTRAAAVAPAGPVASGAPAASAAASEAAPAAPAPAKDPSPTDELRTLSKAILDATRETRRMPLTLAVIILVIVATLTMSLLLSRPNHGGDGLTALPNASDLV